MSNPDERWVTYSDDAVVGAGDRIRLLVGDGWVHGNAERLTGTETARLQELASAGGIGMGELFMLGDDGRVYRLEGAVIERL